METKVNSTRMEFLESEEELIKQTLILSINFNSNKDNHPTKTTSNLFLNPKRSIRAELLRVKELMS